MLWSLLPKEQSLSFPGGSVVKNPPANAGNAGPIHGGEDPLEKKIATHSRILVWEIPWIEEPGGPQSMGSQKCLVTKQNRTKF